MAGLRPSWVAAASLLFVLLVADGVGAATSTSKPRSKRFLIVSSPSSGNVMYAALKRGGGLREHVKLQHLVNRSDFVHQPLGVAVDQVHQRLYIADPQLSHIVGYKLRFSSDPNYLAVDSPTTYAGGTKARWVATDAMGNLYYTDEDNNKIMKISAAQLKSNGTAEVLYDGSSIGSLRAPGGIGVDSFKVYWVNKQQGTEAGSLVRAPKVPTPGVDAMSLLEPLTKNTDKSYGVCLATQNVLYTQPERRLFGVPKTGDGVGGFTTVNDKLKNPRGCVYDGDSTVYVADRGAGAVYAFAGTSKSLGATQATKVVKVEDAFGVALFSGSVLPGRFLVPALMVALSVLLA